MAVAAEGHEGEFVLRPRWMRLIAVGAFMMLLGGFVLRDVWTGAHRIRFLSFLPPVPRSVLHGGGGLCLVLSGIALLRLGAAERLAVISARGVEVQSAFGLRRVQWPQVSRIEYGPNKMVVLRVREKRWHDWLFIDSGAIGVSPWGVDRSQDEILAMIARYRPDLLPGVVPWKGPAQADAAARMPSSEPGGADPPTPTKTPVRAPSAPPLVVDSRGWTG